MDNISTNDTDDMVKILAIKFVEDCLNQKSFQIFQPVEKTKQYMEIAQAVREQIGLLEHFLNILEKNKFLTEKDVETTFTNKETSIRNKSLYLSKERLFKLIAEIAITKIGNKKVPDVLATAFWKYFIAPGSELSPWNCRPSENWDEWLEGHEWKSPNIE